MASLTCMLGVPRSGKSTKAKLIQSQFESLGKKAIVLSEDTYRTALYGKPYLKECEMFLRGAIDLTAKALLIEGWEVILDDTHTSEHNLRRCLQIDMNASFSVVDTPINVCMERAIKHNQDYLIPVIRRCYNNLERIKEIGLNNMLDKIRADIDFEFSKQKGVI